MQERQIIVKNVSTNYKIFGQGQKTLLVLHGWPSKSDTWQSVAETLALEGNQIIVPDLPGFGKSQEPKTAWSLDDYVQWLQEFCHAVPQLSGNFYLVGHSFGGALAAKYTIQYSQQVEKLFLVSAACVREKTTTKKTFGLVATVGKWFSWLPYYALMRKAFYKFIIRKSDYAYVSGLMKETYLKVISDDLSQKLFFIKVPTVIIWGDKDEYTPLNQAKLINQKIEGSKLVVILGAGHALQIKNAEKLAQIVLENL